jgi:hypothetical protein
MHYMRLYLTASSAFGRLPAPDFPQESLTKTAQQTKGDMEQQIPEFKENWPHLKG